MKKYYAYSYLWRRHGGDELWSSGFSTHRGNVVGIYIEAAKQKDFVMVITSISEITRTDFLKAKDMLA